MRPKIGAHVSMAGGLYKAIENAEAIGAEAIQIFGSSPRRWQAQLPENEDIKKYRNLLAKSGIDSVYLHAPYLVNIASADNDLWNKSVKSLSEHLAIAELIGANGLVFHIGSGKEASSKEEVIETVSRGMREVLSAILGNTQLIIENSAGGGQKIGSNISEMKFILEKVSSKRVKVCFDTAHAYEAGMIDYTLEGIKNFFDDFDNRIGIDNLVVLHANDSKTPFNSNNDKHENIGEGFIGIQGFLNLIKENRLLGKPWILEVPGFQDNGPDKNNIDILKSLF